MSLLLPVGFILLCIAAFAVSTAARRVATRHRRYEIEYAWMEASLEEVLRNRALGQRLARLGNWDWDIASRTIRASTEFYALLGLEPSDVPLTFSDVYGHLHIDDHMRLYMESKRAVQEQTPLDIECRAVLPTGEVIHLHSRGELTIVNGVVVRMNGITQDITARKRTEEALSMSRRQQEALLHNLPDIAFLKDRDSRFLAVNDVLAQMLGSTPEDMVGTTDTDYMPEELASRYRADDLRTLISGQRLVVEEPLRTRDGETRWIETIKSPYRDASGAFVGIVGIARDITERRLAEDQLVKQTEILQSVMDNMDEAVIVVDERQQYLASNPSADVLLKYILPPPGMEPDTHGGIFLPDGVTRVTPDASPLIRASRGERVNDIELVVRDGAPGDKRWYVMNGRPLHDQHGVLRGGVIVCRDVTQRQQMERQLLQAQKLEAIGQLAAGIAHEINTPAQYVGDNVRFLYDGFAHVLRTFEAHEALREQVKAMDAVSELAVHAESVAREHDMEYLRDEIPKAIEGALEGLGRIAAIVGAVKGFSHPGGGRMDLVDINRQIEDTVTVSRNEWKYVSSVVTELDPDLSLVTCMVGEMNQVLLNLIVNAAHAIADVRVPGDELGTITISTKSVGERVQIVIRDTGAGIPDEIHDRIFDPFFTTKAVGRGTGQGLAIAHAVVVDKHGGTITFETELGRGTAFTILLPLHPATPLEAAA